MISWKEIKDEIRFFFEYYMVIYWRDKLWEEDIVWWLYRPRNRVLLLLLVVVGIFMLLPDGGKYYNLYCYPYIARTLHFLSGLLPFSVGEVLITLFIAWMVFYPFRARLQLQRRWGLIVRREFKYLFWLCAWFYLAWGLNYYQPNIYKRTFYPHYTFTPKGFEVFSNFYIADLNQAYIPIDSIDPEKIATEIAGRYKKLHRRCKFHAPFTDKPRAKTMLYTPLASMVGVTGSMDPFSGEFTLNGDLPPSQYPATYAHELAHLLGVASEAEASFYAYLACTRAKSQEIRFSGYLSVLPHVLSNAAQLWSKERYEQFYKRIRPEVIALLQKNKQHWADKYSPFLGRLQNRAYDFYLKGNRIASGRKNYSEVMDLVVNYENFLSERSKELRRKARRIPNFPIDI